MTYPIKQIKSDFPIFHQLINGLPLIYLDNAASSQKPKDVINCQNDFYNKNYASAHRSTYFLSRKSTALMEAVREQIAKFINASSSEEIIFTKNTTEGINLVANSYGYKFVKPGSNIIITEMEHHSNIIPWQILAKEKKIKIKYISLMPNGELNIAQLSDLIDQHTQIIAITHLSNVIGTLNPISNIVRKIRKKYKDIVIIVDGAQGVAHNKIDVQKMDCDFYVFSGHKIYGPTGIGVLYGKKKILRNMPPWQVGGGIIKEVNFTKDTTFIDSPWKFEPGSPNIVNILGLGAAIKYINNIGLNVIHKYEQQLISYALEELKKIPNIILYCSTTPVGVISFNIGKHHSYDIGSFLDQKGIAVRTGHHCAMPLMNYFNTSSMCRMSLAMYNDFTDIDTLVSELIRIQNILDY